MSIIKNFRNPWEDDNWVLQTDVLDTSVLDTDVLEISVLDNNVLSLNKALTNTKGFRHGKSLVDKVYNKAVEALKPLKEELKALVNRDIEIRTELKTLSECEGEADLLRKEELMNELEVIQTLAPQIAARIRNSEFTKARREIDKMRKANVIFDVLPTQSYLGEAKFDGYNDEGLPIIGLYYPSKDILDKVPLAAHELKHGYQFINGELTFDIASGRATMLYDIVDEIEAFKREAAFAGGQVEKKNDIGRKVRFSDDERPSAVDIASLFKGYNLIFERIGEKQLSLSTKFKDISQEAQDAIIFGDDEIDESSEKFDFYFRDSDYTLKECIEKYNTVIYYGK